MLSPPKPLDKISALDKLLGQLGIYSTWLSSIAYLQKQLHIFIYFLRHVFGSDYTSFLIEWSHRECAYILTLIVCLSEYQTSGFLSYLNQISSPCWHKLLASILQSFSAKILDWCRYFIHKLKLYCALANKKKSIPDWHLYITQMETKWTKWYAMTSHVIAYRLTELLFGTHTFNFNCFFDDFYCVFTQIRCLSRLLQNSTKFGVWVTHMNGARGRAT